MNDGQVVCFDLGRVLVRLCDDWRHACELAGVTHPPGQMDEARRAALHAAVCRNELGQTDLLTFANETANLFGVTPADVVALYRAYLLEPYPGIHELLDDLLARQVRTACLSNTNDEHWRIFTAPDGRYAELFRRLKTPLASHLLAARKPDQEIFIRAERALGTTAEKIVFFDDAEPNVAAARQRGWRAYHVDPKADPVQQMRSRLSELGVLG